MTYRRIASAPAKKITPAEAAALVNPGYWLDFGACLGQPDVFDEALAARRDELADVRIRASLAARQPYLVGTGFSPR